VEVDLERHGAVPDPPRRLLRPRRFVVRRHHCLAAGCRPSYGFACSDRAKRKKKHIFPFPVSAVNDFKKKKESIGSQRNILIIESFLPVLDRLKVSDCFNQHHHHLILSSISY
jgi:hypothetical protein